MHFLREVGRVTGVALGAVRFFPAVFRSRGSRGAFAAQLYKTGISTLPVVTVVSLFTGMILSLQVGLELARFNQEIYLGAAVMLTLVREMAPFSCGICLAACVGSAIAAEIGTMVVNDEIDALVIMSVPPVRFLAAPRILALTVMAPLVAFYCCVMGTLGGGIVGETQLNVDFAQYMTSALSMARPKDLFVGIGKATLFGFVIGAVSVSLGLGSRRGAAGVGRATQKSVVVSFLLILVLGYVVTRAFYR